MSTNRADPVQSIDWSPDGQSLAYVVAPGGGLNTQIWWMRPDGTGAKRLTAGGKENNSLDDWTDDSRFLRISTNQKTPASMDAMLLDPALGAMRAVVTDKGMNGIVPLRPGASDGWRSPTTRHGRVRSRHAGVRMRGVLARRRTAELERLPITRTIRSLPPSGRL